MARADLDDGELDAAVAQWNRDAVDAYADRTQVYAERNAPKKTGHLAESVHKSEEFAADEPASFPDYATGVGSNLEYAAAQELGARPHSIDAHGPYSLHNAETGEFFGPHVNHPGNRPQPYLRPALVQAVEELDA